MGAVVGLTGVGGGSLMTPLLVLLFNIHPATAVGTDLLHAAITKRGGYLRTCQGRPRRLAHHRAARGRKSADRRGDESPACAISPLVGLGGSKVITVTLGVALLLTAAALVLRACLRRVSQDSQRRTSAGIRRSPSS